MILNNKKIEQTLKVNYLEYNMDSNKYEQNRSSKNVFHETGSRILLD
jgi:hypothetical protein